MRSVHPPQLQYNKLILICIIGTLLFIHRPPAALATPQQQQKPLVQADGSVWQHYFVPHDDLRAALIELIRKETKRILIAAFIISDRTITDELIAAHRRNVQIEVVVCRSGADEGWSKVRRLIEAGITTYIYPAGFSRSLMHHKFAVFCTAFNRTVVTTGSANWTKAGFETNRENMLVQDDQRLAAHFIEEFEVIKRLSVPVNDTNSYRRLIQSTPYPRKPWPSQAPPSPHWYRYHQAARALRRAPC